MGDLWQKLLAEPVGSLSLLVAAIVAVVTAYQAAQSRAANRKADEANRIANEGNAKAEEANRIAKEANEISREGLSREVAARETSRLDQIDSDRKLVGGLSDMVRRQMSAMRPDDFTFDTTPYTDALNRWEQRYLGVMSPGWKAKLGVRINAHLHEMSRLEPWAVFRRKLHAFQSELESILAELDKSRESPDH